MSRKKGIRKHTNFSYEKPIGKRIEKIAKRMDSPLSKMKENQLTGKGTFPLNTQLEGRLKKNNAKREGIHHFPGWRNNKLLGRGFKRNKAKKGRNPPLSQIKAHQNTCLPFVQGKTCLKHYESTWKGRLELGSILLNSLDLSNPKNKNSLEVRCFSSQKNYRMRYLKEMLAETTISRHRIAKISESSTKSIYQDQTKILKIIQQYH